MKSITIKLSRVNNVENPDQGESAHGFFQHGIDGGDSQNSFMLGISLAKRYEHLGELTDIEDAIGNLQNAVQMTKDGHPTKPVYLSCLGHTQRQRFERLGCLTDIRDSVSNMQKAVQSTEDGHPRKRMYLGNLGLSQLMYHIRLGKLADLEHSITNLQNAVRLTGDDRQNKSKHLSNLGVSQLRRYELLSEPADFEEGILNLRGALQFTENEPSFKAMRLSNIGHGHIKRYEYLGELKDIEDAIRNAWDAVELTKDGHPDKPMYFSCLGLGQRHRFERLGNLADIRDSISNLRKAVEFTEDGHPNKPNYLGNLSASQLSHYAHLQKREDIDNSILNLQRALQLTEEDHPNKPMHFSNLGTSLLTRYACFGEIADVEEGISNLQRAVHLTEDGRPNQPMYFRNLGVGQRIRYEFFGDLKDIDSSISNLRNALQLSADTHISKPGDSNDLGVSQLSRYARLGELADVEEGMLNLQRAVEFTEYGNPNKPIYLGALGCGHQTLFNRFGELMNMEQSIMYLKMAVQLLEDRHMDKPLQYSNLGVCYLDRFNAFGDLGDVENSVFNLQKAVELTDEGHPMYPEYLCDLARSQRFRFSCFHNLVDIEASISNLYKAIQLNKDWSPTLCRCFHYIGISQLERFKALGKPEDIEDGISNLQRSGKLMDDAEDYSRKVLHLFSLGAAHLLRFDRLRESGDLAASVASFRAVAQSKTAYPCDVLHAAGRWARASHYNGDLLSALEGYRTALNVLPTAAWLNLSTASRTYWLLREGQENLSCLSATCAIQLGRFEEAVELLDLGRSVFWQQASSLRHDLEKLRESQPKLAEQLERIGQKLGTENFSDPLLLLDNLGKQRGSFGTRDFSKERRRMVAEWEDILDRIRELPQFEHFLRPVPFRQLCQAAIGGQVVIINGSEIGVDALIFDATHPIEHVPLPDVDMEMLSQLADNVLLNQPINASEAQRKSYNNRYLEPTLRIIWNDILKPIFEKIQLPSEGNPDALRRRIWWYPTGSLTFIPIHAAAPAKGDIGVSRLVISSYVTTLSSLLQAQTNSRQCLGRLNLLAVSQPDSSGHAPLPLVTEEIDNVTHIVNSAGLSHDHIVHLSGSDATVDRVLDALDSSSWVHLACHGMQHQILEMNSAFVLHDGDLNLRQIGSKRLSHGQFAFLSACHTAAGLKGLPGEAMHLAGGLQFAGFPSVIATMWSISDKDAPTVASYTYEYLFRNGVEGCDASNAATALNYAVLRLREDPEVTVDRWAPFIHFGI
jgi:CHAT domain-containing protein/tetratricopeptide (TPR) repeat protein